jgi:hypothetical protein
MSLDQSISSRNRTLSLYSLAAGAGVLASGGLSASVVDTGLTGSVSVDPGNAWEEINFDVNGDGSTDFRLAAFSSTRDGNYCGSARFSPAQFPDFGVARDDREDWSGYAALIAAGAEVGGSLGYDSGGYLWGSCYPEFSPGGNFSPDTRGFIGFRFPLSNAIEGRDAGDFFYGYADVEVTSSGPGAYTATIFGIFYEDQPGVPIQAGGGTAPEPTAPVSVPVGGAIPLGLLLLASGALALRRRQRGQFTD